MIPATWLRKRLQVVLTFPPTPNKWVSTTVDDSGDIVADPQGDWAVSVPGLFDPMHRYRIAYALQTNTPSGMTRYRPSHPSGERCPFGLDMSFVLPYGVAIASATLAILTNAASPAPADADWTNGGVLWRGRVVYAILGGGVPGTDYQLQWSVTDTSGLQWPRTVLCLCSETG